MSEAVLCREIMLKVLTIDESQEWDAIVRSFSNHDVYYLSGYVKAFRIHGDGEPMLFFYEDDSMKAVNVLMKRDIAAHPCFKGKLEKDRFFDAVTPYGYGGFIFEPKQGRKPNIDGLNNVYSAWCIREGIICEFVRFHPLLNNWVGFRTMYDIVRLGSTVSMDTSSEVIIWHNLDSDGRYTIRKAVNEGIKVAWCTDASIIPTFMDIYNATMDKVKAHDYYFFGRGFYTSILDDLNHNAMWFYAKHGEVIVSISIFLFCNGKMHWHLSASRKEYQHLNSCTLLVYEGALWACKNGYSQLHLGGGVGSSHDSLYRFKKSFNKNEDCEFHIGKRVFLPVVYEHLLNIRHKLGSFDSQSSYFPLYRA